MSQRVTSRVRFLFVFASVLLPIAGSAHGAAWHLSIPLVGGGTVPSGSVFTREPNLRGAVTEIGVFGDPTATINYMEITFTDTATNGRNYDAVGMLNTTATFDYDTTTVCGRVGAGQIGRDTGGFPAVMTFFARKDFDTGAFSCSTVGNGTGESTVRNSPMTFDASGILYARYFFFRGDGNTGPTVSNIRLLATITSNTMPGAFMTAFSNNQIQWRPSPATEAVAQKLYRATVPSGPYALIQSFPDNTTSAYVDPTAVKGTTYYYRVVAEAAGGVPGANSNALTALIPATFSVIGVTPAPNTPGLHTQSSIVVDFSAPVSGASLTNASVLLSRAGTDGIFDTSDDAVLTIPPASLSLSTSSRLNISLAGLTLPADKYRLSIVGGVKGTTSSSDAIVTVPNMGMSVPTTNFTIEFWQYFTGGSFHLPTTFQLSPIVSGNIYQFHSPWNSGPNYYFWDLAGDRHGITNINTRAVWAHFALVKNATTLQVFYNGTLVATDTLGTTFTNYASDLQLPASGPQPFLGRIDEFRIWNVARTQTQIQTYMKRTLRGNEPGLFAYWDFNEGVGTNSADKTGHGYNGTMTSPPSWQTSDVPLLAPVTDPNGVILDGEFSGVFPSGNSLAGGDFVVTYPLTPPPAFNVTAMSPAPNSVQNSALSAITLNLSTTINAQTVNASSVTVTRAGPDGSFDTSDDVSILPASVTVVGNTQIKFDLTGVSLPSDSYRVSLQNNTIADLNSTVLDGEFGGTFPSGNGTPGGAFTAQFQLLLTPTTTTCAQPAAVSYGATSVALSATVTSAQTVNVGTVSFQLKSGAVNVGAPVTSGTVTNGAASVSYPIPAGTPVGTLSVVASYNNAGAFAGSSDSSKTFDIVPAPLTVAGNPLTRSYGSSNPALTGTISGLKNNDAISATYVTGATAASPIGGYPIVPTVSDPNNRLPNYTLTTTNGVLTVTAVPLSISAGNFSRIYGAANGAFGGTIAGLKNNDAITAAYATPALPSSPVGNYPVVPTPNDPESKLGNYTLTLNNGTLTINKAPLSAAAFNAARAYASENPLLSGTVAGVLNNDPLFAVYETAATTASPAGFYFIVPHFEDPEGRLQNYTVTLSNGTLTVSKVPLTVAVENATRLFGAPNPPFVTTITGLLNNDDITPIATTTATDASVVGDYPITLALADPNDRAKNYSVTFANATLAVTAATPSVLWPAPDAVIAGTLLSSTQLNASAIDACSGAPVAGTFEYSPAEGTLLLAGDQTLTVTFTPDDQTNYLSADAQTSIAVGPSIAPQITSALAASVSKDTAFAYTLTADGSAPIEFSAAGLPDGLVFADAGITGTPTVAGLYSIQLTATNFGGSDTQILKLTVLSSGGTNHKPVISDPLAIATNPALVNTSVAFFARATDEDGDAIDYAWDFGDGTTGIGANVTKTYSAAGVYAVSVTISDGQFSITQQANVAINTTAPPASVTIKTFKIALNFVKSNVDTLTIAAQIPVTAPFAPLGKNVGVVAGGYGYSATLDAKGKSADKAVHIAVKKGSPLGQLTLNLKKRSLFASLEASGFSKTASNPALRLPVIVTLDGKSYLAQVTLNYKVRPGKTGTARN